MVGLNYKCVLNLSGDEFKTCRKHMTKNLSGDTAFASSDRRKNSDDFSESELPIY